MKIAIIGAGIAGLAAADELSRAGHDIVLHDKGRGAGGRMSTRRAQTPSGKCRWDHGAQYFTVRSEAFRTRLKPLMDAGAIAQWSPRLVTAETAEGRWTFAERSLEDEMFVGTPSMNALIKAMAETHKVHWSSRVMAIETDGAVKTLVLEGGGRDGPFDAVVCAIPAEQAASLLEPMSPRLASEASGVRSAPCWAAMLAFEGDVGVDWDGASVGQGPLAWVARDGSKPGRGNAETWVLHATPEWATANLDLAPQEAADLLARAFIELTGAPSPVYSAAHRWLLAKVESGVGEAFGWDANACIGAVGDWRIAPRVEAAWQSGHSLGEFLSR